MVQSHAGPGFRVVLLIAFALAASIGCESQDTVKVRSEFGPALNFSGLGNTFGWAPRDPATTGDAMLDNPSLHQLVQRLIVEDFESRGYVQSESPDFWIDYQFGRRWKVDQYRGAGFTEYEQGSLVIDLIDPNARQIIWRGGAQARLLDPDAPPSAREQRITTAVRDILASVPAAN